MIAVVDYGAGNLGSVDKALRFLGVRAEVTSDPTVIRNADALIVPGVGAFGHCTAGLKARGLDGVLREMVQSGRPFLGICIGMQMLFSRSEEGGSVPGLDLIRGEVRRFPATISGERLKVPHMGWNEVDFDPACPLFKGLPERPMMYFVHSYYCAPEDPSVIVGRTVYGMAFCSALQWGSVFAVQFHPEKSAAVGLEVLRNFAELSPSIS